jgi:curved DNA-binding protein CbpA
MSIDGKNPAVSSKDPYKILGVTPGVSLEKIHAKRRQLAREHHPDRNPGDPNAATRMAEINAACDELSDVALRDQRLAADVFRKRRERREAHAKELLAFKKRVTALIDHIRALFSSKASPDVEPRRAKPERSR